MQLMFIFILVSITLSMIMILLTLTVSKKNKDQEKLTPFECGFDMPIFIRKPFSMKFFLIAIIFLIFDIEIILFLPLMINKMFIGFKLWILSMTMFLTILIWGLVHEWMFGSLKWKD